MPIEDLSSLLRMPRLGKIRLGETKKNQEGKEYPDALDHFLVRPDDGITSKEAAQAFHEVYGDKPKVLDIMFPSEDSAAIFPQYYTVYGKSTGKVCQGDGKNARRWVGEGKERKLADIECLGMDCTWYKSRKCRRLATLQIILPKVPGLGVWHISTTGKNSIININSGIALLKTLTGATADNGQLVGGRISFIPLKLRLKEMEAQASDGKLKTIYALDLANEDVRFMDILQAMNVLPLKALLPDPQDDPRPADLYSGSDDADGSEDPSPGPVSQLAQETIRPLSPVEQKEMSKQIHQVIAELAIDPEEASQLAKKRFGKIDTREKFNEFIQALRALSAQRANGEPPAPLLSEDEKQKMSQEIARVVTELGLEQAEVVQLVEEFGVIDSYARHDAFLQALRDKAARKAQGAEDTQQTQGAEQAQGTADFEQRAIKVAAGLDIPEQVVRQIIRDQFDVLDSQEKYEAIAVMLQDLHDEHQANLEKVKQAGAAAPEPVVMGGLAGTAGAAAGSQPAGPALTASTVEPEDRAQIIGLFFKGLNPLIQEAKTKGVKCSLVVVVEKLGFRNADELQKSLTSRAQVDEMFQRVREKLGLTAA